MARIRGAAILAAAAAAAWAPATVQGGTYIDYLAGQTGVAAPFDPVEWLWIPNPLSASGFGAPVFNDGGSGLNAWRVTDASAATPNPSYLAHLTAGNVATANNAGWRLRAQARLVDDYGGDGLLGIAAFLNGRAYAMTFDFTPAGDLRVTLQDESPRVVEVTSGGVGAAAFNRFELNSLAGNFVEPVFEGRTLATNWDGVAASTGHPGIIQWGAVLNLTNRRGAMSFNMVEFDLAPGPEVVGDFDWSGRADGGDLLSWQRAFGSTTALLADADGSGMVSESDLAVWQRAFGSTPTTTSAPEPSGAALAFWAAVPACAAARRILRKGRSLGLPGGGGRGIVSE